MAINDITLAGGMRSNLVSLQNVAMLQARTTQRLSTGKKVNSAVDDPAAYFAAQNETDRANDLASRKDQMGEAVQTVMPWPICPGVFGIERTMALCLSAVEIFLIEAPATRSELPI